MRRTLAALGLLAAAARPASGADAPVHFDRAREAFAAGKYQEALAQYDAVLSLTGEDAAVRHNRALVYLAMTDPARAADEARRAVALAPKTGRYRITLAVALLSSTPVDEPGAEAALRAAEKLLKRARDHDGLATTYYNLGWLAERRRDYVQARRAYALALRHNPDDDRTREALAAMGGRGEDDPGRQE